MDISRRSFGRLAFNAISATALASSGALLTAGEAAAKVNSTVRGVKLGACMYCFRNDIKREDPAYIDKMIQSFVDSGAEYAEINSVYLEPVSALPPAGLWLPGEARPVPPPSNGGNAQPFMTMPEAELRAQRETLRTWRRTTPMEYFVELRKKFQKAGLKPMSYVFTFTRDMTNEELDIMFQQTKALGCAIISTNQTKIEMGKRIKPFAEKYRIDVGYHNHANVDDANEVASWQSFETLFALSPRFKANLDTGHMVAGSLDPLAFLNKYPNRITHLHMKDRSRNNGANAEWGKGETPLKPLLWAIRDKKLPIYAIVEYEYRGEGSGVAETRKCMAYMRKALTENA